MNICDMCGIELNTLKYGHTAKITIVYPYNENILDDVEYNLCKNCSNEVERLMQSGKIKIRDKLN